MLLSKSQLEVTSGSVINSDSKTCDKLVHVEFTPPDSDSTICYLVNCSDNTCVHDDELPVSLETNTVDIYAVNRCGSVPATSTLTLVNERTCSGLGM